MRERLFKFLVFVFFSVLLLRVVWATRPTNFYSPWETSNPSCSPWDSNCNVEINTPSSSSMSNRDNAYNRWNHLSQWYLTWYTETDPNVEVFAKTSLPSCSVWEVLKWSGWVLSCVFASWTSDNLWNHTATQNLNLTTYKLVWNGWTSGISITSTWAVWIWITTPTDTLHLSWSLRVTWTVKDSTNSAWTNGQILSSTSTGTKWIVNSWRDSIPLWKSSSSGEVYSLNDIVNYNWRLYINITGTNTDTSPDSDAVNWSYMYSEELDIMRITDGMSFQKPSLYTVNDWGLQFEVEAMWWWDITFRIDGVDSVLDCTTGAWIGWRARVALIPWTSATNPTTNYIYVTNSWWVATLNTSTTVPTGAFWWIWKMIVPDATTWNTTGPYLSQRYTESFLNDSRWALSHEREKIRALWAVYLSWLSHTLNITTNPSSADNVHLAVSSWVVYQLHRQTFPAISTWPYYYGNWPSQYMQITDLNQILTDSEWISLSGKHFNLVIWWSVNYSTGESKLFVNIPDGSYNNDNQAKRDRDNTADYTVPDDMRSTAFLIARVTLRHDTKNGGTWENLGTYSLLGNTIGSRNGWAAAVASNDFEDAKFKIFDNVDSSKELSFEVSGISTATVRTITVPDGNGTLGLFTGLSWGQKLIWGTATTDSLSLQSTSWVWVNWASIKFLVGNNWATQAMTVSNTGSVGIWTASPTAQLHTTWTVRFENFGAWTLQTDGSWNLSVSSDERLKDISWEFTWGIDKLLNIDPIVYSWNKLSWLETKSSYVWFSAQNIKENIPEAVWMDNRGYLTLQDRPIVAALVNAVKEIWRGISENDREIERLKKDNEELRERLLEVEKRLGM